MTYSETRFVPAEGGYWKQLGTDIGIEVGSWLTAAAKAALGFIVAMSVVAAIQAGVGAAFPAPHLPSSTVKVELAQGHGSGVHIGDGLILTAAHVASEGATVKLKLDDGTFRDAAVVWSSKASDVALLRTAPVGLSVSPLSCAPPVLGQAVTAHGNPLDVEFITTYGHIVGAPQARGEWTTVAVVDMEIIPGMSGGPVLNPQGEVVGISVGLVTFPIGFSVSATGLGMIVPAEHICVLLGRT